jgi:signal-transduction protein with cAMP-binding, CBS, and nucleotidyltransferase domain
VPLLKNLDDDVLTEISEYIVPKKYTKNEIIIQEKEPLQMVIFIVEGHIIIEKRDFPSTLKRSAGEVYGEKLLSWPEWTSFPSLPVATDSVKAGDDVEALVLMARDMEDVGWKFRSYFSSKKITHLINDELQRFESARVTMLRKVS